MNDNLSDLQKDGIKKWTGKDVLTINPKGSYGNQSFKNRAEEEYNSTEFWCAMQILDDMKVPREEKETDKTYSIVGRIKWLAENK
jgi:hypothetical protein